MALAGWVWTVPAKAQEPHQHDGHDAKIGRVDFATSCSPKVREQVNRAVAWLHSFETWPIT
jgi:hypothetical protein